MKENFEAALARILVYEGGKVNDPRDPGGKTNKGITQTTYSAWLSAQKLPNADVYNISDAQVAAIYKGEYWDRIQGDSLPTGLDLVVFDAAVNSGPAQSVKWLQNALGMPQPVDGVLGSKTLRTLQAFVVDENNADALIKSCCALRLGTLERLSTFKTFGKGWTARISNVQQIALAWEDAGKGPGVGPAPIVAVTPTTRANVTDIKPTPISPVKAHVATIVTTVAATVAAKVVPADSGYSSWTWALVALAIFVALGGLLISVMHGRNIAATAGSLRSIVPKTPLDVQTKMTKDLVDSLDLGKTSSAPSMGKTTPLT